MKGKYLLFLMMYFCSCSPIKSSPEDERHKMELTLHEIKVNLDSAVHDLADFKKDILLINHKIVKEQENYLEKEAAFEELIKKYQELKKEQENISITLKELEGSSKEILSFIEKYRKKVAKKTAMVSQETEDVK